MTKCPKDGSILYWTPDGKNLRCDVCGEAYDEDGGRVPERDAEVETDEDVSRSTFRIGVFVAIA